MEEPFVAAGSAVWCRLWPAFLTVSRVPDRPRKIHPTCREVARGMSVKPYRRFGHGLSRVTRRVVGPERKAPDSLGAVQADRGANMMIAMPAISRHNSL